MEEANKILKAVESKFQSLKNFGDYKIIDNILCLSCYIQNDSNYFILYPNGDLKYRTKDYWEYTSSFNKEGGFGNGIAFIDLKTFEIIKLFYFKDDLNFDWQIPITFSCASFIVAEHEERTHIIFLDNFSISSFGGLEYKVYEPYILFFPYSGYSGYDTFGIIDTITKKRIDLNQKLSRIIEGDLYLKEIGWFNEHSVSIDVERKNIIYQYQHSRETFAIGLDKLFRDIENIEYSKSIQTPKIQYYNLQVIEGNWEKGISLDMHRIKSRFNPDGSFDVERSFIGELLYKIKYHFDKTKINDLAEIISNAIQGLFPNKIDVLIPIPPSNMNRPFQPLQEIATQLSKIINVKMDESYLEKIKVTPAIKQVMNIETRKELLKDVFRIKEKIYKGKTVLLFDDLYRSGETLNAVSKVLKEQGEVGEIYVLTITKTITKK